MAALEAGKQAPQFELPAMDGSKFSLQDALHRGPVLAVFFKNSCPVCQYALPYFERAYAVMGRVYDRNPVQIRPWHASLGVLIAGRYRARGDMPSAEVWYRRVLSQSPLHRDATMGLAAVLRAGGDDAEASRLCAELKLRLRDERACESKGAGKNGAG